ncbi:MAG: MoaD/ThiS family protein [Saprospiraceae bacterium]|nr:MoaD/ThiS family protein [Saprospiraceae bacterium]MCF8251702.1 MoaD/ThiS family protein [Saprospiraceae bacterium]MCF8281084.1 MoaD/ThiS family protein [Bacteroidales bacterium]MCF8311756.1 MoaD/ThiS family protein [Saprospiraceae bacterium]MCF8441794.1 MoaD/ThiS family protein [Saprospiraceae bacterium]
MKITILSFGIAKDITGQRFLEWELPQAVSVGELRKSLVQRFPRLAELATVRLAVNNEYASEELVLGENDEVALIPPVSGG